MNSLCLCTIFSCLFAVTTQQSRTVRSLPKNSDPPYQKRHPLFWALSSKGRNFYIQSKNIWFIQISQNGSISGTKSQSPEAFIVMLSGDNQTVVMKGKVANKYICMDKNAKIYAGANPTRDCFFREEYHASNWNTYHHSFHRRGGKKNYLAINHEGKVTVLNTADDQQVFFLPFLSDLKSNPLTPTVKTTTTVKPVTTTRAPTTTSTVAPNLKKLEKTRKRRRRWCKLLIKGRLEKKPDKYLARCKHDCNILKTMLDNIKRYKRKCDKQRQRRRRRNRRKKQRKHGVTHSIRHSIRHERRRTKNSRGRGRDKKVTAVRATPSPHVDVT